MSENQPTRSELASRIHQFAQAAISGELSPDEARRLEDLVVNDPAARDIYASFILDTVALRDLATEHMGSATPDSAIASNSEARPLQIGVIPSAQEGLTVSEPEPFSLRGFFGGFVQSVGRLGAVGRLRLAASLAAIATAMVVAIAFGIVPLRVDADKPELNGSLVAASNLDVSSIKLDSGTTRLTLPKVGQIIVEGPAEFELLDPMRARLTNGRIKVRVTVKSGRGFVVETPYGEVTDLGTEFALDVPKDGDAGLVVFDGAVDLRVKHGKETYDPDHVEHLVQGEGVTFNQSGQLNRIGSIVTGTVATFLRETVAEGQPPLIVSVGDNRRSSESKKFYEIVPGGMNEDALAHVDRPHQWNGMTAEGMPTYLRGADYIKTFAEDRLRRHREIKVTLGRPATLYVLFDKRISPPAWLKKDFEPTRDSIGMDLDRWGTNKKRVVEVGPGNSVNARYTVWKRVVKEPGVVVLGPPYDTARTEGGMYGIAAVALDGQPAKSDSSTKSASALGN